MLRLSTGDADLVLAPEVGGAIAGWRVGGRPILRPTCVGATGVGGTGAGDFSCFPLVPYSNRIAGGAFGFGGAQFGLRRDPDQAHSIHGVGWQRPWRVDHAGPGRAVVSLTHAPDAGWPFAFHATQAFELTQRMLAVTMTIENRDDRAAPAGLGLHPFFPTDGHDLLRFKAGSVWRSAPDMLPTTQAAVPVAWNHSEFLPIGTAALDNCFAGWDGLVTIRGAAWTLEIEATEPFRHLVVHTPAGQDFFCVEPVSHMNDGVNRAGVAGHGVRTLAPGEMLQGSIYFRLLNDS